MARDEIHAAAREFLAAGFAALASEHVLPTTRYHPYIRVGRDYFGDSIMTLREFNALSDLLSRAYPGRFAEQPPRLYREFPQT